MKQVQNTFLCDSWFQQKNKQEEILNLHMFDSGPTTWMFGKNWAQIAFHDNDDDDDDDDDARMRQSPKLIGHFACL